MKYKAVAWLNIFNGLTEVLWPLVMIFMVTPSLNTVYSQLSENPQTYSNSNTSSSIIIFLLGFVNLFFGYKLLTGGKEKYYKFGVVAVVSTYLITGYLAGQILLSMLTPMYQFSGLE